MGPNMLAVNWLDQLDLLSNHAISSGKIAASAAAIVFIILGYIVKRTLGAVFAAALVAGLVLYAVNNTDALKTNTKDTFTGMGSTPALVVSVGGVGSGVGGGGGGAV